MSRYEYLSIDELQESANNLYNAEVRANKERKKVVKVLRARLKQHEAAVEVEIAKAYYAEAKAKLASPSWWDRLKAKLGYG